MKCPDCGYPNPENSSTCFSCGAKIEVSRSDPEAKDSHVSKSRKNWTILRADGSERWEILLIASILAIASAFLPWASAFYRDTLTNAPVISVTANLIDLLLSNDLLIASLAAIFIVSIAICAFIPAFVVVPASSLVLMAFYMPQYLLSQLPAPTPGYYSNTGLGSGYLIAWISVICLGTFLLRNFRLRFSKGHEDDKTPSEQTYWEWGGRQ